MITSYYFNGGTVTPAVLTGSFTDIASAADGDTLTYTVSSEDSSTAIIGGTTAPGSGGAITQVRGRIFGGYGGAANGSAAVYTAGQIEGLGTINADVNSGIGGPGWGSYTTLTVPTGGWNWSTLQSLETILAVFLFPFGGAEFSVIEIEVTHDAVLDTSTTLVSPTDISSAPSPVEFVWEIPTDPSDRNLHFQIQIDDTDNTFASLEAELYSYQTTFEYWDGDSWEEIPIDGVASTYYGNEARVSITLTEGTKHWRVRGGAI